MSEKIRMSHLNWESEDKIPVPFTIDILVQYYDCHTKSITVGHRSGDNCVSINGGHELINVNDVLMWSYIPQP